MTFNIANALTGARIVAGIGFFICISSDDARIMLVGFVLFVIAGLTDIFDGYFARRQQAVTKVGRVADPFADKFLVSGGFIMLLAKPELAGYLSAWMVVVIVGRELLVMSMRSFSESQKRDFGTTFWGKSKTFLQYIAIGAMALFCVALGDEQWARIVTRISIYAAVAATIISGAVYMINAGKMLQGDKS